jgi:hypothetical protein
MPSARVLPRRAWGVRAAAAALSFWAGGCNLGSDRLRCTLDPAQIELTGTLAPSCAASVGFSGLAFSYFSGAVCGEPCPPPWTVQVTWRNLATGETGQVPGTFQTTSCWPLAATACAGPSFGVTVPLAIGTNRIELEAEDGDGFSACRTIEVQRLDGC